MRPQEKGAWRKTIRREAHRARVTHRHVKATTENLPRSLRSTWMRRHRTSGVITPERYQDIVRRVTS